jgi:hypothetical protein
VAYDFCFLIGNINSIIDPMVFNTSAFAPLTFVEDCDDLLKGSVGADAVRKAFIHDDSEINIHFEDIDKPVVPGSTVGLDNLRGTAKQNGDNVSSFSGGSSSKGLAQGLNAISIDPGSASAVANTDTDVIMTDNVDGSDQFVFSEEDV